MKNVGTNFIPYHEFIKQKPTKTNKPLPLALNGKPATVAKRMLIFGQILNVEMKALVHLES